MAKILLIETATQVCSVAIGVDGKPVGLVEEPEASSHASLLTLQIEACVRATGIPLAALDAVAVSSGPGSYTSLRVGASVAKGICYALDKPLIAVDTLLALADASRNILAPGEKALLAPVIDARRQEVWTAVYDETLQLLAAAQPFILENNSFENFVRAFSRDAQSRRLVIAGNGTEKTRSGNFSEGVVFSGGVRCSAAHLASLAEAFFQKADFQDVAYFEPFYMKPPNITTPNPVSF